MITLNLRLVATVPPIGMTLFAALLWVPVHNLWAAPRLRPPAEVCGRGKCLRRALLDPPLRDQENRKLGESPKAVVNSETCSPPLSPQAHAFPKPPIEATLDTLVIYFDEPHGQLELDDINAIERWTSDHRDAEGFTIDGYTDSCGASDANQTLSLERAKNAEEVLRLAFEVHHPGIPVPLTRTMGHGEQFGPSHHEVFRRVEIRPIQKARKSPPELAQLLKLAQGPCQPPTLKKAKPAAGKSRLFETHFTRSRPIEQALVYWDADQYLIDQSGSMSRGWQSILDFAYERKSKLWLSTTVTGGQPPIPLSKVTPFGTTEIFWSLARLLESGALKAGERLLVLSDYDSSHPLNEQGLAWLRATARERGILVCAIDVQTGLPYEPVNPTSSRRADGGVNAWHTINACKRKLPGTP